MQSILHTAKELLLPALRPGGTAADFTMGNTVPQPRFARRTGLGL